MHVVLYFKIQNSPKITKNCPKVTFRAVFYLFLLCYRQRKEMLIMTRKRTSEKLKNLYKIFGGVFGASLLVGIANLILSNYWYMDSVAYELAELLFGGAGLFFGFLSGFGIVPLFIMAALVIVSIVFAVKENNHKNVLNFGLFATLGLITVSAFLQNMMLTEMV
jgi:hypothetical protein